MFNNGYEFLVKDSNIIGKIIRKQDDVYNTGINLYLVYFIENGNVFYTSDVYEDTLIENIRIGFYIPCGREEVRK